MMMNVRINGERAGRIDKPAKSIDIIDPETGEILGHVSFSRYGWGDKKTWALNVSAEKDLRVDLQLNNKARPELMAGAPASRGGGMWRFDPSLPEEEAPKTVVKTIEKLIAGPVEIIQVEKRIEPEISWRDSVYGRS